MSIDVEVSVLVGGVGGARFLLGVQQYLGLGQFTGSTVGPPGDHQLSHRQRRRRCLDARRAHLPRPRHLYVHLRWRDRPRTWLGSRDDLACEGGTRRLRRAARLVRVGRPRPGHPPGAQSDAQGGIPVVGRDRGALRTVAARCPAPPGDRRPKRNPRHRHRSRADRARRSPPCDSLPGVVGALPRSIPTHGFAFVGADKATAAPGVVDAIAGADVVFLAPSNPVVSVGPILAVPGIRAALRSTAAPVIGYSPIVSGRPLRGMADVCLSVIGVESSSQAVAPTSEHARVPDCSTAGSSMTATVPRSPALRCGPSRC